MIKENNIENMNKPETKGLMGTDISSFMNKEKAEKKENIKFLTNMLKRGKFYLLDLH